MHTCTLARLQTRSNRCCSLAHSIGATRACTATSLRTHACACKCVHARHLVPTFCACACVCMCLRRRAAAPASISEQRCGAFVGTFSSNFGRLAYELQLATSPLLPPTPIPPATPAQPTYLSLDSRDAMRGGSERRRDSEWVESRKSGAGRRDQGGARSWEAPPPLPPVSLDFPWYADP